MRSIFDENQKLAQCETGAAVLGEAPRRQTRLERYENEKRMFQQRIALLDEAIAALKSNPETERIINLLDAL